MTKRKEATLEKVDEDLIRRARDCSSGALNHGLEGTVSMYRSAARRGNAWWFGYWEAQLVAFIGRKDRFQFDSNEFYDNYCKTHPSPRKKP